MSSETTNIGLVLPELSEAFDLERHWNHNSTIIDAEIGVLKQTTAEHTQDIEGLKQTTMAQGQLIARKQDQLTFDTAPTSGSSNPVTSDGIHDDQQRQETEIGAVAALGAKNLLKVTSTTQTINGVTFTVNNDQTITVNGTNTGTSTALFVINDIPLQSGIAYTLSGCPSGGSTATYYIGSLDTTNWSEFTTDTGNGGTATLSEPKTIQFRIGIRSGVTVNNLVFKPMLRRAEITDDTFEPYAPTNRELYETKAAMGDVYGYGSAITSSSNLNDYTQPGSYYCPNAAVAGSLTNTPVTDAGFRLVVESLTNTAGRFLQTIHANGNDGAFYQRKQTSQGMSQWYKFEGTQVASLQSAPESLMQAGRLDAELSDALEVTDDA